MAAKRLKVSAYACWESMSALHPSPESNRSRGALR